MNPRAIRREVLAVYDTVGREGARSPLGDAVPTGRTLARELGYAEEDLERAPPATVDAFVGVAALALEVAGEPSGWVADLGCGAGLDSFVLARRGFRVLGIEASATMIGRLARLTGAHVTGGVAPVRAMLPAVPVSDGALYCVLMNGVANLCPERDALLREVSRVLRRGGTLLAADLLAVGSVDRHLRELPEAWAWCVGGAVAVDAWETELEAAGFSDVRVDIRERFFPLARGVVRAVKR